jgi:hypothetical protein
MTIDKKTRDEFYKKLKENPDIGGYQNMKKQPETKSTPLSGNKVNCDYKSILIFDHDKHMGTFNIPPDIYEKIHKVCKREKITVCDFIYNLMKNYVEMHE